MSGVLEMREKELLHCMECNAFCRDGEDRWFWNREMHAQYQNYTLLPKEMVCHRCGGIPFPGGWSNVSLGWATAGTYGRNRQ